MTTEIWNPTISPLPIDGYLVKAGVWNNLVGRNLPRLHRLYGFRLYLDTYTVVAPANEVQKVASTGGHATAGVFKVGYTYNVYDKGILISSTTTYTPNMVWNVSLATFTANLQALTGLNGVAVTGSSLNAGFTIVFSGPGTAGIDVPTLLKDDSALVGDTITVSVISSGDPYSYIFVSAGNGVGVFDTARPGDPNLEGLWWVHGHSNLAGASGGQIELRKQGGLVIAHSDNVYISQDVETFASFLAGETLELWVDHPGVGVQSGNMNTYLEAYYMGVLS